MANLHCQSDWVLNDLEYTPLGIATRGLAEKQRSTLSVGSTASHGLGSLTEGNGEMRRELSSGIHLLPRHDCGLSVTCLMLLPPYQSPEDCEPQSKFPFLKLLL